MNTLALSLLFLLLRQQETNAAESNQSLRREAVIEDAKMFFEIDSYKPHAHRPWRTQFRLPTGEIVGGYDAREGEYPWFVSLEYSGQFYCGGSLLSGNKVLSAAHCFFDSAGEIALPTQVRIGHVGTTDGETVGVDCVTIHPDFASDMMGLYNDVAVLTLSTSATTTNFVRLNGDTDFPSMEGETLTAIGFGRTTSGGSTSSSLQKATEQFVPEDDCQATWSCASSEYHLCAAEGTNIGVCQGDSGGPLLDISGKQVGITSFGDAACGTPPDVFANVAPYKNWIEEHVSSNTCTTAHTLASSPCNGWCVLGTFLIDTANTISTRIQTRVGTPWFSA